MLSGALAVAGALAVILVHHLGYREFRAPSNRKMLGGALVGCGLQATAFLLTGNVLAPVVAHIVLHLQLIRSGNELPPTEHQPTQRIARAEPEPRRSLVPASGEQAARG
jgi:hypothetical protein